jgi:hypothetical protein
MKKVSIRQIMGELLSWKLISTGAPQTCPAGWVIEFNANGTKAQNADCQDISSGETWVVLSGASGKTVSHRYGRIRGNLLTGETSQIHAGN